MTSAGRDGPCSCGSGRPRKDCCGDGEDRRRALAAGFDLHVAKPVEPAALVALVNELVGSRAGARHHEAIDARV